MGETVLPEVEQALRKYRADVLREAAKIADGNRWSYDASDLTVEALERLAAEAEEGK